jgi:hypothetical protein
MRRTLTLGPIAAASLFTAVVCAQDGAAPSPSQSRVRISGTGSNIVLEREPRPERKSAPAPVPEAAASPVDAATQLKSAGASDEAVLSHLRAHAGEIPPVILAEDVRRLRKSGAGPDVIAWLSRNTALDIGETGEGHESPDYPAAPPPQDYGMGVYEAGYAVPWGGYAAPYSYAGGGGRFGSRVGRHGRPPQPVHHGSPARPIAHGNRAIVAGGRGHRMLP